MTRDPLAVARDPLAVACRLRCAAPAPLPAIRWPWRACPLARDPRSDGRDPLAVARLPCPLPAIRRHPLADPASSAGRSGVIRWPIRRHPLADPASSAGRSGVIRWPIRRHPLADPASSAGRSGVIRWPIRRHPMPAIRCLRSDQARSRIRAPRVRGPYGN
jgi:hypothetical protein